MDKETKSVLPQLLKKLGTNARSRGVLSGVYTATRKKFARCARSNNAAADDADGENTLTENNLCRLKLILYSLRRASLRRLMSATLRAPDALTRDLRAVLREMVDGLLGKIKATTDAAHIRPSSAAIIRDVSNLVVFVNLHAENRKEIQRLLPPSLLVELIAFLKITATSVSRRRERRGEILEQSDRSSWLSRNMPNRQRRLRLTSDDYDFGSYEQRAKPRTILNEQEHEGCDGITHADAEKFLNDVSETRVQIRLDEFGVVYRYMRCYLYAKYMYFSEYIQHGEYDKNYIPLQLKKINQSSDDNRGKYTNIIRYLAISIMRNKPVADHGLRYGIDPWPFLTLSATKTNTNYNIDFQHWHDVNEGDAIWNANSEKVVIFDVIGDGECLFHSLFAALYRPFVMDWDFPDEDVRKRYFLAIYIIVHFCDEMVTVEKLFDDKRKENVTEADLFQKIQTFITTISEFVELQNIILDDFGGLDYKSIAHRFIYFDRFLRLFTIRKFLQQKESLLELKSDDDFSITRQYFMDGLNTSCPDPSMYVDTLLRLFPWLRVNIITRNNITRFTTDTSDRSFFNTAEGSGRSYDAHKQTCLRLFPADFQHTLFVHTNNAHYKSLLDTEPGVLETLFRPNNT